jgi:iron(III) transport system ATP-binding protein
VIRLEQCRKQWGARVVFDGLSLEVPAGASVAVLGPSGAGKTTLLRMIAGLEKPDAGRILLRGDVVSGPGVHVPPSRRRLGFAFQDDLLWPHMTVRQHLEFALDGQSRQEREARVEELLLAVGLKPLAQAHATQLSGGEARRLSLARACAARRDILLLDEPLAHLDPDLHARILGWLREEMRGRTCLVVTHDAGEAAALAGEEFRL